MIRSGLLPLKGHEFQMDTASKFLIPGVLFLLTLASGVWLSHSGRPLAIGIFTLHKLIALAGVIVTAVILYNTLRLTAIPVLLISALIFARLCVAALFATGALLSLEKPISLFLLTAHRIAPFLAFVSMAAAIYQIAGRQ
jgi:hypothetical protein